MLLANVPHCMIAAIRFLRRFFLFGSLAGLVIAVVMFFVPAHLYTEVRVPDDVADMQLMWGALGMLSLSGLVTAAVLYSVRLDDEPGPLIIHR